MERLSVIKLESLEVRRIRADLKLCFKIIYGLCDLDTNDFFTLFPPHLQPEVMLKKIDRCSM